MMSPRVSAASIIVLGAVSCALGQGPLRFGILLRLDSSKPAHRLLGAVEGGAGEVLRDEPSAHDGHRV